MNRKKWAPPIEVLEDMQPMLYSDQLNPVDIFTLLEKTEGQQWIVSVADDENSKIVIGIFERGRITHNIAKRYGSIIAWLLWHNMETFNTVNLGSFLFQYCYD